MVKIEAVIQSSKLSEVKASIQDLGILGVSISEILVQAGPSSRKVFYRGAEYAVDIPMFKLEMLVSSFRADEVVEAITLAARTGTSLDDGIILVFEVADAISIRSGERVELALL